ncbi:RNA polymerase sigma factor [Rhodothermus profundi]|uniref:RNA polymerase sigma-70 factor, ECF subfamily n=1 Tax=Rhodothermus profundi TaxID=633813 RepID=A0A1M6WAB7_9BACT|nr:sigma-70 family RNA polymerase sigma factor [Rhodothermus profundi]SHK90637.1 RNA polymerase sigma-70 factor, ECF subfamily [Rhodothermus profundi]
MLHRTRIVKKTQRPRSEEPEQQDRLALLQQMSDEDLMEQFQAGTVEAFNILVERYSERLMHYLYGFLGDARRCEDLLQETFLRVYRNRHSYQRIAKFSTWLYTIAGNLARSEYRKRKRRRVYSIQSVNRDDEEYEIALPDETFAPDKHAESIIQDKYIQEALRSIPPDFREVVVLRDVQQLTYEEIAQITGLPMGTVKSRINRGRTKLQALLKDIYAPEEV